VLSGSIGRCIVAPLSRRGMCATVCLIGIRLDWVEQKNITTRKSAIMTCATLVPTVRGVWFQIGTIGCNANALNAQLSCGAMGCPLHAVITALSQVLGSGPLLVMSGSAWYIAYLSTGETCPANRERLPRVHVSPTPADHRCAVHRTPCRDAPQGAPRWRTRRPPPSGACGYAASAAVSACEGSYWPGVWACPS
jgi:hypothetical protein